MKEWREGRGYLPLLVHRVCVCVFSRLVACYSERESRRRSPEYISPPRLPWRAPGQPIVGLRARLLKLGVVGLCCWEQREEIRGASGTGDVRCLYLQV